LGSPDVLDYTPFLTCGTSKLEDPATGSND
jgi:hypothetical protein